MNAWNVVYRDGNALKVLTTCGTEEEAIIRRRDLKELGYPPENLHLEKIFNWMGDFEYVNPDD